MAAFDFAKVKDPTFFKENVLNAHASFRTYASREEYRTGSSSLALKLDGIWKFAYAKNYTSLRAIELSALPLLVPRVYLFTLS